MRLRHLTDIEIQALLDRRTVLEPAEVPGPIYLKDLDSQEHLDHCPACKAELEMYRELYSGLGRAEVAYLPRNFATKVTFSLPPFRAQRTRARLQVASVWAASLLASLVWLLGRVDWSILAARAVTSGFGWWSQTKAMVMVFWAMIPHPDFDLTRLLTQAHGISDSITRALATDGSPAPVVLVAGLVLLLAAWLDRLYLGSLLRRH
jgi:anti-sigma factor RsiW